MGIKESILVGVLLIIFQMILTKYIQPILPEPKVIGSGLKAVKKRVVNILVELLFIATAFIIPIFMIIISVSRLSGYDIFYIYGFSSQNKGEHILLMILSNSLFIILALLMFLYNVGQYKRYKEGKSL